MNTFQRGCLAEAASLARELASMVTVAEATGRLDVEAATSLIVCQLGAIAAGFDQDMDHATLQQVIRGCGLAGRQMRGTPANDQVGLGGSA